MTDTKRKGARSIKDIPVNILEQLNRGEIESANLVEFLGVNRKILIENLLTQSDRGHYLPLIFEHIDRLQKITANTINEAICIGISEQITLYNDNELLRFFSTHPSDIVRCMATNIIGRNKELSVGQMLDKIRPFATDRHFNVRECAWADTRGYIAQNLIESLSLLTSWATDENENIRRFASEVSRPRGVWSVHIAELKENPELGLSILEPLKSDNSKYVRDSVGNWLNDASKSKPEFVIELCERWRNESDTVETDYIIKKALRTIEKEKRSSSYN